MPKASLKVMTVVGTRPEVIRLARVTALLDQFVHHVLVHTGQNYDHELNAIFFDDLRLRPPDHCLAVDTASVGRMVGDIIAKTEDVLKLERPDALLVLGDTNSCMAAYAAKRLHVPVYHMEAGNRSFDPRTPEEVNRRIIDHLADYNLAYTEHARRHLLSEGLPHQRILVTGSPLREVLDHYDDKIAQSTAMARLGLKPKEFFLASVHREENVDDPQSLAKIVEIFNRLAAEYDRPVIVSTHPRTRKRLAEHPEYQLDGRVNLLKPMGFTDYVHLEQHALCVLSDSGTISEESAMLGFPAVCVRESMERPESQDAGSIVLAGLSSIAVADAVRIALCEPPLRQHCRIATEYEIRDTSWRVLKLLLGNARTMKC